MPRKRAKQKRTVYILTGDFAQGLVRFKGASGLPWAEIARLLGTSLLNLWRWRERWVQPNSRPTSWPSRTWPTALTWATCSPRRGCAAAPRPARRPSPTSFHASEDAASTPEQRPASAPVPCRRLHE